MFNNRCMPRQCPVVEPTVTNCVEETIYHNVEHIVPVHTHTIKKHIYNHTYTPRFTQSEECQVINNECGCQSNMFR